jgi:electron transfer flavoprotein alpha subunit
MSECVLVIAEHGQGELNPSSLETLVAGQKAAEAQGLKLVVAVLGAGIASLAEAFSGYQVDRLLAVENDGLANYGPEAYSAAVTQLAGDLQAGWVFFAHTYQARDFAPRVAARLGRSLISDCVGLRPEGDQLVLVRSLFQGKLHADVATVGEAPHLVSFQPASFSVDGLKPAGAPAAVESLSLSLDTPANIILQAPEQEGGREVDLSQAEIIVSVGRGIGDEGNIEQVKQLAAAMGGELAASRPVCDEGWLPIERQVGSSGQTVAPKLYLALGISGASQHLMGMKGSHTIVAVNKDPKAPIFAVADYGIVGDVLEVVPALIEALNG